MTTNDLDLVWKALADPTRRTLLDLLRERPRTTGELAAALESASGLTRFAVMKHLGILEAADLVVVRRKGRERWNHLNAVPLRRIYERWVGEYAGAWSSSLLRLQSAVESQDKPQEERQAMNSFEIAQEVTVAAPPERVFAALTGNIGAWWNHSFSAAPRAIRLEPQVGGRFYEEFGDGQGGALYATVTRIKPGEYLILSGPMGMDGPVIGVVSFELAPNDGTTLVKLTHHVIGAVDADAANGYDAGWATLLQHRLKPYVESN